MNRHRRTPCKACPYRTDAPLGLWAREHYESCRDETGPTFGCHGDVDVPPAERSICAGFLQVQKARGIPSIPLRLALCHDADLVDALKDGTSPTELFTSQREMADANIEAIDDGATADPEDAEHIERFRAARHAVVVAPIDYAAPTSFVDGVPVFTPLPVPEATTWGDSGGAKAITTNSNDFMHLGDDSGAWARRNHAIMGDTTGVGHIGVAGLLVKVDIVEAVNHVAGRRR